MDYKYIVNKLEEFGVTDKLEIAHFLAQSHHESQGFLLFNEMTKYRFIRALSIWPSYKQQILNKQTELQAKDNDVCPQPWLFNLVYGNRLGNQDNGIADNDGYDYKGSGLFQLTGKYNYMLFLKWLNLRGQYTQLSLEELKDFCQTEKGAILSAIWYWLSKNIGEVARKDDIFEVTKKINGGRIGLPERIKLLKKYKAILGI